MFFVAIPALGYTWVQVPPSVLSFVAVELRSLNKSFNKKHV